MSPTRGHLTKPKREKSYAKAEMSPIYLRSGHDAEQSPLTWDALKGVSTSIIELDTGAGYEILHGA